MMKILCAVFSYIFFLGAAAFDNTNDNIRCGTISIVTNITLEAWVFSDSYGQSSTIVLKEAVNANWVGITAAVPSNLEVRGGSTTPVGVALSNLTDGQWHFITFTIEGTTGTVYIDGVSKATGAVTAIGNSGSAINIGNFDANNNFVWDGRLAEIRIWDDIRTVDEINAYRFRRLAGNEPNLVGYWSLGEQTGTNAADHQTNLTRNDGTLELFAAGSEWGDGPPMTYGE